MFSDNAFTVSSYSKVSRPKLISRSKSISIGFVVSTVKLVACNELLVSIGTRLFPNVSSTPPSSTDSQVLSREVASDVSLLISFCSDICRGSTIVK